MGKIEAQIIVRSNVTKILELAKRAQDLPSLLPEIKEVKILENGGNRKVSHWKASSYGINMEWKQEDIMDLKEKDFRFKMLEGDFRKYEGCWSFEELNGKTRVTVSLIVELGIPLIGAFMNNILMRKIKSNMENLLEIIKKEAEENGEL